MKNEIEAALDVDSQQIKEQDAKELTGDAAWSFLAGPVFLLCTLAITSWLNPQELSHWLMAATLGMVLSVFYRMRGCIYAICLLAAFSFWKNGWFFDQELLHLGLEGSFVCSFVIMALSTDQRKAFIQSLTEKSSAQELTIGHLEQNLSKLMQSSQDQQISFQEKIAIKQKELEEAQSELSSILVLNEVLRKTTAVQLKESQQRADSLIDRERKIAFLLSERSELQLQLEKLKNDSQITLENEKLFEEINQVRCDYAQLELLHENLTESYSQKAKVAEEAEKSLEEMTQEKELLRQQVVSLESENEFLRQDVKQLSEQISGSFASESVLQQWEAERNCWQERLQEKDRESMVQMAQIEQLEKDVSELKTSFGAEREKLEQKIESQKNELNDLHSEISSGYILNQTLRDTLEDQAQDFQDKEQMLKEQESQLASFVQEKQAFLNQLEDLRNESKLVQENTRLTEELTTQGYQVSEIKKAYDNLEYLYKKQALHAEEVHQNLCAFSAEKQALQQEIGTLKANNEMLKSHVQKLSERLNNSSSTSQNLEQMRLERNFLEERLKAAEIQIAALSKKHEPTSTPTSAKENPALAAEREALLQKLSDTQEHLSLLEEKFKKAAQVEALYHQLRAQFEEKNKVLQETRAQLFHTDTELQKLRIEKQQKEIDADPLASQIQEDVKILETEIADLQQENLQLQEMISQLLKKE